MGVGVWGVWVGRGVCVGVGVWAWVWGVWGVRGGIDDEERGHVCILECVCFSARGAANKRDRGVIK